MQTKPEDIEIILPYGEALRQFMEQPFITKADLRATLRSRGIFTGRGEKADTIPVLISCVLSPREFDSLRERQVTREDNPKTNSRFLEWASQQPLLESIPESLNLNDLLKDEFVNYKIVGAPTFVAMDQKGSYVRLDFEIERRDLSKCWCLSNDLFKGSIELERVVEGNTVKLILTHTAGETKSLAQKIAKNLETHFRASKFMPAEGGISRILFGHFSNEERVTFFWSLTADIKQDWFEFEEITDFNICPAQGGAFPPELKWMEKGVRELNLKGKELQENLFIKNKEYHSSFLFFKMDARFKFNSHFAKGDCAITFEFADFDVEAPSTCEFETNIFQLNLAPEYAQLNKIKLKERLLREIDTFTHSLYKKIISRPGRTHGTFLQGITD